MFNDKPYKEDNESFPEPLILCPGHVPSQAGGQNGQLRIYGLSLTVVTLPRQWWARFEPFCAWTCQSRISHGSYPSHCGQHLRKAAAPPWQFRLKNLLQTKIFKNLPKYQIFKYRINIAKLFSREVHQGVIDEQAPTAGGRLEQLLNLRNCQIIDFDLPFTLFVNLIS